MATMGNLSFLAQITDKIARNKENSGLTHKERIKTLSHVGKILVKEFDIRKLENLKEKHVKFIIEKWKDDGRSIGTIKNVASHLRWLCEKLGKSTMMPRSNEDLGIEKRVIDYNTDKAWIPSPDLKASLPETQRFHIDLMREFGMRFQEAGKFRPAENIHGDRISIIYGTKGGRDRDLEFKYEKGLGDKRDMSISPSQKNVLERLKAFCDKNNVESLSRMYDKYTKFEDSTRNIYTNVGITKKGVGTPHGLRHKYAQDRYTEMTGWKPPACMTDEERRGFRGSMSPEQKELDRRVRLEISEELGHGRSQVTSNYVGSWKA